MKQCTISLFEGVARNPLVRLALPATIAFGADEHLAVVGLNGSGKSLLIDTLLGKYPLKEGTLLYDFAPSATNRVYENVKYIAFRDTYGASDVHYYYQQRWNAHDQDDAPEVREILGEITNTPLANELFELFRIAPMLDKKVILLSSGELRKFQLVKALLAAPRVLIMDNPFIGLDAPTREMLHQMLGELAQKQSVQIVLVLSMCHDIPEFITHVLPVDQGRVLPKTTRDEYLSAVNSVCLSGVKQEIAEVAYEKIQQRISKLPLTNGESECKEIVKMSNVGIRYGDRTILKEFNWTVQRGEKWALSGGNGSGKSTLLSLICADNPQSYACDINLFGRKRGTGESIWEIKKQIGYVSPEMHRAYQKNMPTIDIVASGLHDSIGLYKRSKQEQMNVCEWWMDIFGIAPLRDKPFLQISSGEQRLALLARAFVKDPELLILDEPLHGLDTENRRKVKKIIEAFCSCPTKTLIMVTHYESELPKVITNRIHLTRN